MKQRLDDIIHEQQAIMGPELALCVQMGVIPSTPTIVGFGLTTSEHYEAIRFAICSGNLQTRQLVEVACNGPAITELVASVPGNPWRHLVFQTPWDQLEEVNEAIPSVNTNRCTGVGLSEQKGD